MQVTKEVQWDCAHQLLNHKGLCRNIHGHTYKLRVTLEDTTIEGWEDKSSEGMVIDFSDLKKVLKEQVVDKFDHAFVAWGHEPLLQPMLDLGYKVMVLGERTTAENMSQWIWNTLYEFYPQVLKRVRLYEVYPTSYAEVTDETTR